MSYQTASAGNTSGPGGSAEDSFRMFIMDEAARQRELAGKDIIRLTLGISDLPLHPAVIAAIDAANHDPRKTGQVFPEGLPELREALAAHYTRAAGAPVSASRILIDAGTSSIYPRLIQLLAGPGDEVLLPLPYYPLYRVSARIAGVHVRDYRIDLDTLRVDMDSFEENLSDNTRLVVVNSPGNPLGNVVSPVELRRMCEALPEGAYLAFDEIYENVLFDEAPKLAPGLLRSDSCPAGRVIVTNSCSKGYRMYTKRVGWCVLPEQLVGPMSVLLQHTRLTVDPAVQYGAVAALGLPGEVEALRAVHRQRRDHIAGHLRLPTGMRLIPGRGGFYCMLDCRGWAGWRGGDGLALAMDILDRAGVAVVPGEDFGLPGTFRMSFTARRFEEAVGRLDLYFRERS